MKRISILFTCLLCLLQGAADVSGRWSGTIGLATGEGSQPIHLVLHQDGTKLTGTVGPSAEIQPVSLQDGSVLNGVVHFKYERFGIFTFDLTLKENHLTGRNVPLEGQPSVTISVERVAD
jgi:hypothetical protein